MDNDCSAESNHSTNAHPAKVCKTAFGLDLAGYSGGRSGLAKVQRSNHKYEAIVYRNHPFSTKSAGKDPIAQRVSTEQSALNQFLNHGSVLVDVPIDLQGLPSPPDPFFTWQLTARPIDFAYKGLSPLADRIGAPVARFKSILNNMGLSEAFTNGQLLETYPAASFLHMKIAASGYKRQSITWNGDKWIGNELAEIARAIGLFSEAPAMILSDDDIDAIVCGLTGASPIEAMLLGDQLVNDMRDRLRKKVRKADAAIVDHLDSPQSYRLLRNFPGIRISVGICEWENSGYCIRKANSAASALTDP